MEISKEDFIEFHHALIQRLKSAYEGAEKDVPKHLESAPADQLLPPWVYGKGSIPENRRKHLTVHQLLADLPEYQALLKKHSPGKEFTREDIAKEAKSFGSYLYEKVALPLIKASQKQREIGRTKYLETYQLLKAEVQDRSTEKSSFKEPSDSKTVRFFIGYYLSSITYSISSVLLKVSKTESNTGQLNSELYWFHGDEAPTGEIGTPGYTGIAQINNQNIYAALNNSKDNRVLNLIGVLPSTDLFRSKIFRGSLQGVSYNFFLISAEVTFTQVTESQLDKFISNGSDPVEAGIMKDEDFTTLCLYLRLKKNVFKVPFERLNEFSRLETREIQLNQFGDKLADKTYQILPLWPGPVSGFSKHVRSRR